MFDARLAELGIVLPGPHPPHDPLDAVVVHDGVARTSGQLPRIDGTLTCLGRLGDDVTVEQGYEASAPGFDQQPAVVDGASHVLRDVFGDAGRHTRSAVGVAALPRGGAVEIEVTVALRPMDTVALRPKDTVALRR